MTRHIVQADALAWLKENPAEPAASVITSLPDVSELPELGLEGWRAWFIGAARAILRWLPEDGVAIFYQSDVRHRGVWIDKGYLVLRAAEEESASLVWHKIVCRRAPGSKTLGRPSYSHMLCLAKTPRPPGRVVTADVLPDAGHMPWSRAMGINACRVACEWLRDETRTRVVVDPFCGRGTVLAVAEESGFETIGVDLSARRCKQARGFALGTASDL